MITRITQKNLAKHPIHPTMPSPNSSPRNPNSCIPQPIMPRSTNAPIPINMISSIVILWLSGKVLGMFFLFHGILYLCIMNILEQLARLVLPKEILDNFDIVKIETDESNIDSMSMTIHLDERMNAYLQKSENYESKGFMDAVRITDFPIRDHKVILVLRRRRWRNKETGETFVDRISVTESGTRYSKEFAAFLKETYGHIPDDLPYA